MIELLNQRISTKSKYICVTRPRRFGKSTVKGDKKTIESILHDIHNSEIPILQCNDENSL